MDNTHLEEEIQTLENQLADLQRRLPAHSIPPGMIAEMDELEDRLQDARQRLQATNHPNQPTQS